jgi:hypothetical protein
MKRVFRRERGEFGITMTNGPENALYDFDFNQISIKRHHYEELMPESNLPNGRPAKVAYVVRPMVTRSGVALYSDTIGCDRLKSPPLSCP